MSRRAYVMKCLLPFLLALASCSPAFAGVRYTLHLQLDQDGKHSEVVQNSWIQGSQAKLIFEEDFKGSYEVDAEHFGDAAYSVDEASHHITRINLPKHDERAGVHIENLITNKTLQEPGPVVLGHPTTHLIFVSKFDYYVSGGILKGSMTHELWVANDLADQDLMNWMMFQYRLREGHVAESLFREVTTLGGALPVAYDGIARIKDDDGNTRVIRIGATVESLEKVNIDPSVFATTSSYDVLANTPKP